ncbi:MAG: ABC transporter ATP-binding protein, partial [Alphaproteobacteria bacterium]|nr:ABC transporter ATP-binding protein [Alphaproteobacteria bacterium]
QIRARVAEMVALLHLGGLEDRYPAQLSGGQRQRVAVARALAIRPDMLLLDEAFSALDRNLREEMQLELSLLLRRLMVTTIVVTHDQREAFALADRIAVMEAGRIVQIGPPEAVYRRPVSSHVLRFLGTTNRLDGTLAADRDGPHVALAPGLGFRPHGAPLPADGMVTVHVRAEDVMLSAEPTPIHAASPAVVTLCTFLGAQERVVVEAGAQQIVIDRPAQLGAERMKLAPGQVVYLSFDPAHCQLVAGQLIGT